MANDKKPTTNNRSMAYDSVNGIHGLQQKSFNNLGSMKPTSSAPTPTPAPSASSQPAAPTKPTGSK